MVTRFVEAALNERLPLSYPTYQSRKSKMKFSQLLRRGTRQLGSGFTLKAVMKFCVQILVEVGLKLGFVAVLYVKLPGVMFVL